MDLEDFRREYLAPGLHRKDLDASPFRQFEIWLKHAIDAGLRDLGRRGGGLMSIGGAGTFDGIVISGFLATMLST